MKPKMIFIFPLLVSILALLILYHTSSPYLTPSQVKNIDRINNVQVIGRIAQLKHLGGVTVFYLTDGKSQIKVIFSGNIEKTNNEVVVVGDWKDNVLHAKKILRKCHTEYR